MPDTDNKKIEIGFSGRVGFEHGNSKAFFENFVPLFSGNRFDEVIIDLSKADFIYPAATLFVLMMRRKFEETRFTLSIPLNTELHEYLHYCGCQDFFDSFPPADEQHSKINKDAKVFKLHQYSSDKTINTNSIAGTLTEMYESQQAMSPKVKANIIDSIDEVLRNVKQHSEFANVLIVGQTFPISKRIRLAIYDDGMGIRNHLTRKDYSALHAFLKSQFTVDLYERMKGEPANLAIEYAARECISGTNYEYNSGAGLNFLINDLAKPCNGDIFIISEDGFVHWNKGEVKESFALPYKIKGTMICMKVDALPDAKLVYTNEG